MARRVIILCVLFVLAAVAPASAQVQRPADVLRVESAMGELGEAEERRRGPGQGSRSAPPRPRLAPAAQGQRLDADSRVCATARSATPTRAAPRPSGTTSNTVATEGAWVERVRPLLRALPAPLRHAALRPGAPGRRRGAAPAVVFNRAAYSFGTCATFNTALKKVREFKIGGEHGVSGDYYAGKIYNDFVRYVSNRQRAAARSHWGSRYDSALEAAQRPAEGPRRQRGPRELLPLRVPRLSRAVA